MVAGALYKAVSKYERMFLTSVVSIVISALWLLIQHKKIPLIKAVKQNVEIGWDGGANLDNIRTLAHSGANVINVGSAISNAPDPAAAYRALVEEADKRGVKL